MRIRRVLAGFAALALALTVVASALAAHPKAGKKYAGKWIIVTGEVAAKQVEATGSVTVQLKTNANFKVTALLSEIT